MDRFGEHYILSHFAKVENGIVVQVIVVDNADTANAEGVEMESIGAEFCKRLLGGDWKQTSYNGKMRKNFAGIGYTYDSGRDAFIAPQPFPSWLLNEQSCQWESPVPMPTDGKMYQWDEATLNWIEA